MKNVILLGILTLGVAFGVGALSLFPRGYGPEGVFQDFSSPASALKSYFSAVYAADERLETSVGIRWLRRRSNRYRGWDAMLRRHLLCGKRIHYTGVTFAIADQHRWGDGAQILIHEISPNDSVFEYTYDFELEEGLWKMSDMGPGNRLRH